MRRNRTTKWLASRIDATYVRRPERLVWLRRLLIALACVAAAGWWAIYAGRGDQTIYSPGPVASAHAMWNSDCAQCHQPAKNGGFVRSVSDAACLKCHDAAIHVVPISTR